MTEKELAVLDAVLEHRSKLDLTVQETLDTMNARRDVPASSVQMEVLSKTAESLGIDVASIKADVAASESEPAVEPASDGESESESAESDASVKDTNSDLPIDDDDAEDDGYIED